MVDLPQPTKSAKRLVDFSLAAISGIPVLGFLGEFVKLGIQDQMESAYERLIDGVRKHGIEVLSDKQVDFFLPAAYRFIEQVRLGDYEHNIRILSDLIAKQLSFNGNLDSGIVGRVSRQIEYLEKQDLVILAALLQMDVNRIQRVDNFFYIENVHGNSIAEIIEHLRLEGSGDQYDQVFNVLARLIGRGLLFTQGSQMMDSMGGVYYCLSKDARSLRELIWNIGSENRE